MSPSFICGDESAHKGQQATISILMTLHVVECPVSKVGVALSATVITLLCQMVSNSV